MHHGIYCSNILRINVDENLSKQEEEDGGIVQSADNAANTLEEKGWVVSKITVSEIQYLLFDLYNMTMSGSKLRKPDYMNPLYARAN